MQAARLFGVGDLRVVDVPVPDISEAEVLLKVRSVGVCGSDIARVTLVGAHHMPLTIGHEFSAEIASVGSRVQGWSVGDRVAAIPLLPCGECHWCRRGLVYLCPNYNYLGSRCDGGMAEYVKAPAVNLFRVPQTMSFEQAAMIEPSATGLHALWRGSITVGDTVIFFGVGPIGLFMVQWARIMGARRIIAVDMFDEKLELARRLGATDIIHSKKTDPVKRIKELTDGLCGNLVIDSASLQETQIQSIQSTTKQGKTVFLGISHDALNLPAGVVNQIMRDELTVTGSWNSYSHPFPGAEWTQSLEYMLSGALQSDVLVSHRLPISQAPKVIPLMGKRESPFNKVLFNF